MLYDDKSEENKQKRKSKFFAQSSKQNTQYLPYVNEIKRVVDSTEKKDSKKSIYYKKIKTEAKRTYNNIRKSESEKKENENNIILTSSVNAIVDFEKEIDLDIINNRNNSYKNNSKSINNSSESNKKCRIF